MRIGAKRKEEMINKILDDLYLKPRLRVIEEKIDITKQGYNLWIAQFPELHAVQPEFLHYVDKVLMQAPNEIGRWSANFDNPVVYKGTIHTGWNRRDLEFDAPEEIHKRIQEIHDKHLKIEHEYGETRKYLINSFDIWNTTAKLKKNWPVSLHKYIPVDPKTVRKKSTVAEEPTLVAPVESIQNRMTLNILEG